MFGTSLPPDSSDGLRPVASLPHPPGGGGAGPDSFTPPRYPSSGVPLRTALLATAALLLLGPALLGAVAYWSGGTGPLAVAAGLGLLAGVVGAAVLLAHRVLHPVTRLAETVERATGEGAPPGDGRRDELQRLDSAVGRLTDRFVQRGDTLDRVLREAETFVEIQRDLT
jgi:HAMP domain-containing protein